MKPAVVIDNGSSVMKAGFSGEVCPRTTFETCVGHIANHRGCLSMLNEPAYYVGKQAMEKRRILRLKYPVERGVVANWDDMEKIWKHIFDNELRIEVGSYEEAEEDVTGVLLTEIPMNLDEDRERTTEIMFETYEARRFYLATGPVLSMYASGRTTGVAVECGHGVSHTVPVYEGYSVQHAIQRSDFAGGDLTDYMYKILTESEINLHTAAERESAAQIKEELCWVSMDYNKEVANFEGARLPCSFICSTSVSLTHTLQSRSFLSLSRSP